MKQSFFASAGLHFAIALALIVGLPHLKQPPLELQQPIPIDIMDLGPVTTTSNIGQGNKAKPEEIAPPPKAAPPEKKEAPETPKVEPPKPAPPAPQKPEKKEPPKEEEPTISNKKKKPAEPKKQPEKKQPEKPAEENIDSLLKNLIDNNKPPAPDAVTDAKETPTPVSTGSQGVVSEKLTISEEDLLRRQIEQCWNIPIGGMDAGTMVVELLIEVNPDRTVKEVNIIDQGRMNSDSFFRAMAESAVRAVKNSRCSPLQLPEGKYDMWKNIRFNFDPKQMAGL